MPFHLYASNNINALAKKLNDQLGAWERPVFQPVWIITQTDGMNNWLRFRLAEMQGIAANIQFNRPNDVLYHCFKLLGGKNKASYTSQQLSWLIFSVLGEKRFKEKFPSIASYYSNENDDVKRMALAEKLSDLFDQYQVYRVEMMEDWNAADAEELTGDQWQNYVWIKMKELAGEKFTDKARMGEEIIRLLKEEDRVKNLVEHLPEVHIFGISIFTEYHLEIFTALSAHIRICYYLQNPAPSQYWYDDLSEKQIAVLVRKGMVKPGEMIAGNSLLSNWGKVLKDACSLLFKNEDFLNAYEEIPSDPPGNHSLLEKTRQDIFYNRPDDERTPITRDDICDGSVTINSCYTISREVEALYNYLVKLANDRENRLSPRDIVVMVTDIDAYAPYIKAVFDNGIYPFPYAIADQGVTVSDNILLALKSIMELDEKDFTSEHIIQLLDSASIREHFGIHDLSLIRSAVDRANIRFGIHGDPMNDTNYVCWKNGINRLVYGICMEGEEDYLRDDDILNPVNIVEGTASLELVRFVHFIELLIRGVEMRKGKRPIKGWVEYVYWVLNNLVYQPGETVDEDYQLLSRQLNGLMYLGAVMDEEISFDVFRHHFVQQVNTSTRTANFLGRGITFCSMIPMRSIPFRVVAMLGMNLDKFPRKDAMASFDLMQQRQKGDRSIKDNDKHLFLETIVSAKEHLYISYIGQNVKDNSRIPPSILVDELIDYVEAAAGDPGTVRKEMVCLQPLHSFSRRYVSGERNVYNYISMDDQEGELFIDPLKEPELIKVEETGLQAFVSFFKNPFRAYYNKVLNIRYEDESSLLQETELFELDHLQKWFFKNEYLDLDEKDMEAFIQKQVRTGRLPLKNMAVIAWDEVGKEAAAAREAYRELIKGKQMREVQVNIELPGLKILGPLPRVFDRDLVFICFSKNETRYQMEAYILYLAGIVAGEVDGLYFISGTGGEAYRAEKIGIVEAKDRLGKLVNIYLQGCNKLIPFFPGFCDDDVKVQGWSADDFQMAISKKVYDFHYPLEDPYILNEFKKGIFKEEAVLQQYRQCSSLLIQPLEGIFQ